MKEFQKTLEEHVESLVKQSEDLLQLSQERTNHEHAMAEYERGETAEELVSDATRHREFAEKYEQLRMTHEGTKQWHRSLLSQWEHLHKGIFGTSGL